MNERAKLLTDKGIHSLSQSLAQGYSDNLKAYLATMAKFHKYSWHNCLLIWIQKPEAAQVAGFRKWLELGRCVKEGEKGIMILAPVLSRKTKEEEVKEPERNECVAFTCAWVFDVSQTEGRQLPSIGTRKGDPGSYYRSLLDFAQSKGIEVSFHPDLQGANGKSRGGKIELLESLTAAESFGVLVHEIAHELLHQGDQKGLKPKVVRELEAEATAFVVCQAIGLEEDSAGADYIHLYQGDAQLLMASLSSIQKASSQILKGILN